MISTDVGHRVTVMENDAVMNWFLFAKLDFDFAYSWISRLKLKLVYSNFANSEFGLRFTYGMGGAWFLYFDIASQLDIWAVQLWLSCKQFNLVFHRVVAKQRFCMGCYHESRQSLSSTRTIR